MASSDSLRQENGVLNGLYAHNPPPSSPLEVRACASGYGPTTAMPAGDNTSEQAPQPGSKQYVGPDMDDNSEGTKSLIVPSDLPERSTESTSDRVYSDTDKDGAGERPVRQKLKETSIAGTGATQQDQGSEDSQMAPKNGEPLDEDINDVNTTERGRLKKKRSLDDLMNEDGQSDHYDESGHRRKRSRDSKAEGTPERDAEPQPSTSALEKIKSPKKKRSRDQFDKDLNPKLDEEGLKDKDESTAEQLKDNADSESLGASTSPNSRADKGEPEKKRHRDNSQDRHTEEAKNITAASKTAPPNPFSNISTTSPFASLDKSKGSPTKAKEQLSKEQQTTNPSAFAASSLAAFAGSDKSPFGAIGGGSSSVFKAKPGLKGDGESKASSTGSGTSSFAAASGPSPFGSSFGGSAFGKSSFASGFGAAAPKPGERLTSFASPKPTTFGAPASKPKVFGAKDEDEDEEDENDDEEKGQTFQGFEEEKEDTRFFKQDTETGEEGEETRFTGRGKLFHFTGSEWKERGVGTFKLNAKKLPEAEGDEEEGGSAATTATKRSARFIMRTDGVFRVILNIPLYKGMKVGDPEGNEPTGKHVQISGIEDGRTVPLLLRTSNAEARDLYAAAQEFLTQL
ncbi:hypothetical protein FQN49_006864 [Arthroderma sp. PD_2]|nr:hypothetical protein FQN49_006864 [Arthroderma sp. PD_2]